MVLKSEVSSFVKSTSLAQDVVAAKPRVVLPRTGFTADELRSQMEKLLKRESNTDKDGNVFAYTYTLKDEHYRLQQEAFDMFCEKTGYSGEHDDIVKEFFHAFMHENALNPMIFPALRLMETEVVSMTAAMLNGSSETVGFLTSGGTESNLMAVKTFRDMARAQRTNIRRPNIIAPITVHPTIDKAAHYFDMDVIHTPVGNDFKADVNAIEQAINSDTVMIVASAPQFCHSVIDPIEEIAALAARKGIPLHVDACFGGFMVEKLGYKIPKFDFRIPGVTSISADVHKYGYSVKGASVVMYRNASIRKFQIYAYSEWPGGLYGSPSMAGTRPGGNIAAAWAAMKALGEDGYMRKAKELMLVTDKMKEKGLCLMGEPCMTAFAIGSDEPNLNIQAVADAMETKGWKMERNQLPDSLHCSILPHHISKVDKFLDDLEDATDICRNNKALAKKGTAGVYGMMANIPDKGIVTDFLVEFFSEVYKCK
ncbi:SGPL-like protein [Mya arenaria]|uniref:SGPL-like protein n=1 Tax=Mya arenaria TaxID=6604 RepID=A0ABY7F3E2_MYAAR|nr:SGPL-like protein [Mya arenaria]